MMQDEYLVPGKSYQRLHLEYKKYGSLCIGFDFDNTVHDFHKKGETYHSVIKLLKELKKIGCKLICWTSYQNIDYVNNYLYENKIPFDNINGNGIDLGWETPKPFFSALLDDRAGLLQVYTELTQLVDTIKNENI